MECPNGHGPMLHGRKYWRCEDCDYREPIATDSEPPTVQVSPYVARLPSVVAIPLHDYGAETHPVMRLHRLCDAVELLTRFCTIVALGEMRRNLADTPLPPALLKRLQPHIERPSFGEWRHIMETLTDVLGKSDSLVVPELREWVYRHLLQSLSELVDLRNVLAHGGATSRAFAEEHLRHWEPWVASQIEELEFLATVHVCFLAGGKARRLAGLSISGEEVELPDGTPEELRSLDRHVVLVRDKQWLDLWPLCDYGRAVTSSVQGRREAESASPMIYFRAERDRLMYAALGADLPYGERPDALEDFRELFRLAKRVAASPNESADFENEIRLDAAASIGRLDEVRKAKEAIKTTNSGVLWIGGQGGIGKSFLMAKLAADLGNDEKRIWRIAWRFKVGDGTRCNRTAFLRHAVKRVAGWLGTEATTTEDPNDLYDQLETLLDQAVETAGARPHRVLFVLDGLDEIERVDPTFPQLPFQLRRPHVVWLCAGRPERTLPSVFSTDRCRHVFPGGLPAMSPNDIRGMLLDRTGSLKYRLLPLDAEYLSPDGAVKVVNAAVDAVVQRARGLPLYVHFVVQDILAGHFRFEELPFRLPDNLNNYYDDMLRRLSIGELQALLTPLLVTIAWARAPLDEETLHLLMVRRKVLLVGEHSRVTLRRGLDALQSMLRLPREGGEDGHEIYHPTFREHIQGDNGKIIGDQNPLAQEEFAELTKDWENLPEDHTARAYALRFGPCHLLALQRRYELVQLLTDIRFVEARAQANLLREQITDLKQAASGEHDHTTGLVLRTLAQALIAETAALTRFPDLTFQTLVNSCRWSELGSIAALIDRWKLRWWRPGETPWLQRLIPPREVPGVSAISVVLSSDFDCAALAFSPDGDRLAGAGASSVNVWDVDTGRSLYELEAPRVINGGIVDLTWSHDGCWVAAIGHLEGYLALWHLPDGQLKFFEKAHDHGRSVAFCPQGLRDPIWNWDLLSCGTDSYRLWFLDPQRPEVLLEALSSDKLSAAKRFLDKEVPYSPPLAGAAWGKVQAMQVVIVGSECGEVVSLKAGVTPVVKSAPRLQLHHVSASEDGRFYACVADSDESPFPAARIGNDHTFVLHDNEGRQEIKGWRCKGHLAKPALLAAENGMVTCEEDHGVAALWSLEPFSLVGSWQGPRIGLKAAALGPEKRIAVSTKLRSVLLLRASALSPAFEPANVGQVWHMAISPDGAVIAGARSVHYLGSRFDGDAFLVRIGDQRRTSMQSFEDRNGPLTIGFLPDGRLLTGHMDGRVIVWSPDGEKIAERVIREGVGITGIAISRSGDMAAVSCASWYDQHEQPPSIHLLIIADLFEQFADLAGALIGGGRAGNSLTFGGVDEDLVVCSGSPVRMWRRSASGWSLVVECPLGATSQVAWSAHLRGFMLSLGSARDSRRLVVLQEAKGRWRKTSWVTDDAILCHALSECGRYIAFADSERICRFGRFEDDGSIAVLGKHFAAGASEVWSAAVSWKHKLVAFGDSNGDIHVFRFNE